MDRRLIKLKNTKSVSEVKKVRELMPKINRKNRELAEMLNEIVVEVNLGGEIIYANKKAFEKTGYTKEEIDKGINIKKVVASRDRRKLVANFSGLIKGKKPTRSIYILKRKDGSTFPVITYPDYILDNEGKINGIRELLIDISDIKEAEEKIKESEESYRSLFENSLDGIYRTTLKGKYIDANPSLIKMLGYGSKDELLAIDIPTQLYARKEDRPKPDKRNRIFEARLKKKDGSIIEVEINSGVTYKDGKPVCYEGIVRDITERKILIDKIKEDEKRYHAIFENTGTATVMIEKDTTISLANSIFEKLSGYSRSEIENKKSWTEFVMREDLKRMKKHHHDRRIKSDAAPGNYEFRFIDRFGNIKDIFLTVSMIPGTEKSAASLIDISDIKEAEEKIKESEESYRSLFENSLDGIYRTTLKGKYIDANPSLIKMLGYGSKDELLAIDIPTQLYARKEDRPKPDKRNRIFEARLKKKDGSIIEVEINSGVTYKDGKPVCYEGIVRDITERKIAEKKIKESYRKLQKVLNDVISTLASIVEVRDPYTSGHQKRVTSLAIAIAEELGLNKERIEAIGIAALIHDIGKINLPESILTWPGKLSEIEYGMIKTHPQLGYDMIKHIDFPEPVADIVLQHHERIDGSGYPKGLKRKEIIPEAKILAVADVVEAMASHRPYRPSLGMESALKEIRQNRGKLYEPKVVNACIKLINSKKFNFE